MNTILAVKMNYILAFILAYPVPTFIILCILLFVIPFIIGRRRRKRILNELNEIKDDLKNKK